MLITSCQWPDRYDGASPRPAGQRAWHLFAKQGGVPDSLEPCGPVAIDAY